MGIALFIKTIAQRLADRLNESEWGRRLLYEAVRRALTVEGSVKQRPCATSCMQKTEIPAYAATDVEASNTCNQNPLLPAKFLFCVFSFSGCQLFYVARTFVVFTDVFDGFNTECFQDGYIDVGQFFYVDADFTHLEFAESG